MDRTINAKQLRAQLPDIVKRVRRGQRFTVLYRSQPAFRLVPVIGEDPSAVALEDDTVYGAEPVGSSVDGLAASDHDMILYR
jgi:prevent-host-death family protein